MVPEGEGSAQAGVDLGVVWRIGKRYFKGMGSLNSDELARLSLKNLLP
jgi:hypothetical protein